MEVFMRVFGEVVGDMVRVHSSGQVVQHMMAISVTTEDTGRGPCSTQMAIHTQVNGETTREMDKVNFLG